MYTISTVCPPKTVTPPQHNPLSNPLPIFGDPSHKRRNEESLFAGTCLGIERATPEVRFFWVCHYKKLRERSITAKIHRPPSLHSTLLLGWVWGLFVSTLRRFVIICMGCPTRNWITITCGRSHTHLRRRRDKQLLSLAHPHPNRGFSLKLQVPHRPTSLLNPISELVFRATRS